MIDIDFLRRYLGDINNCAYNSGPSLFRQLTVIFLPFNEVVA